jgi:hypothetical protein
MATRRYGFNPGYRQVDITEGVGAATASKSIELTVDLATTVVNGDGTTRGLNREEVMLALEEFKTYIMTTSWPPA